jgi:uncharacterized protein (UPF0212 family)
MPNYLVTVRATASVLVCNAKDEEEALELGSSEPSFGDFEMADAAIEVEVDDARLANAKRNADYVVE